MKDPLSFDHRPDPVLGDALRRALDPGEEGASHAAFVVRVLAGAEQVRLVSWDGVLARWARGGVAAALVVALAAGYVVGRVTTASPAAARPTMSDVLVAPPAHPGEVEVVLASVIGNN